MRAPPNESELFSNFLEIRNVGQESAVSVSLLTDLITGLTSQAYLEDYYTAYTTILKLYNQISAAKVLELINSILTNRNDSTKGERRIIAAGRVAAMGGLVRSGKLTEVDDIKIVLKELGSHSDRKGSIPTMANSFILSLLDILASEKSKEISLIPLQHIVGKPNSSLRLQIVLRARELGLSLEYDNIESLDDLCDTVLTQVQEDDSECLETLFSYLLSVGKCDEFWATLTEKLRKSHLPLLVACISAAVIKKCPIEFMLTSKILRFLLESFRRRDHLQDHDKARKAISLLLDWSEVNCAMNKKQRKQSLEMIYGDVPNLLVEYKFLNTPLQQLLKHLTAKEIQQVSNLCTSLIKGKESGDRLKISTLSYLSSIAEAKATPSSTKLDILYFLFTYACCCETVPTNENEVISEAVLKNLLHTFSKIISEIPEDEIIDEIFQKVYHVIIDKHPEMKFKGTLRKEIIKACKRASKLTLKNPLLTNCLKLHLLLLIVNPSKNANGANSLAEICEDDEDKQNPQFANFIFTSMFQEGGGETINYEAILQNLFQDKQVLADSIPLITSVIDAENISMDDEDDDDESDSDDSENEEENIEKLVSPKLKRENKSKNLQSDDNNVPKKKFKPSEQNADESDSESSIDMDEATSDDLAKMDEALANVFSTKKKIKEQSQLEMKFLMKACKMLELIFKWRAVDGTILSQIVMPCISSLVKASKGKNTELSDRIAKVVKRLNSVKELEKIELVDEEIVDDLISGLKKLLQNKLTKKTRKLIQGTHTMILKCFQRTAELETKPKSPVKN